MKNKITNSIKLMIAIASIAFIFSSCTKEETEVNSTNSDPSGIWQRYGSPKGYQTDLAIGNIPGEPSNRVYMCEHPGSPSAGLYKGYISGNIVTWDSKYGLPNAEFKPVGNEMTLYFGVGSISDAGKYKKGNWTNTCGELKHTPKNIYYQWTNSSTTCIIPSYYTFTYNYTDLPSTLTKNQQYGPIIPGSVEIIFNNNGNSSTKFYCKLSEPPTGYKRIYTHNIYQFNNDLNRCLLYLNESGLSYVDLPL